MQLYYHKYTNCQAFNVLSSVLNTSNKLSYSNNIMKKNSEALQ